MADRYGLTPMERIVLDGLVEGFTLTEIAERETRSVQTLRFHTKRMLKKLGVHSQIAAIAKAHRDGWVTVD